MTSALWAGVVTLLLSAAVALAIVCLAEINSRQVVRGLIERTEREVGLRSTRDSGASTADRLEPPDPSLSDIADIAVVEEKEKVSKEDLARRLEGQVALLKQSQVDYARAFERQQAAARVADRENEEQRNEQKSILSELRLLRLALDHLETTGASDDEITTNALMQRLGRAQNELEQLVTDLRGAGDIAGAATRDLVQYQTEAFDALQELKSELTTPSPKTASFSDRFWLSRRHSMVNPVTLQTRLRDLSLRLVRVQKQMKLRQMTQEASLASVATQVAPLARGVGELRKMTAKVESDLSSVRSGSASKLTMGDVEEADKKLQDGFSKLRLPLEDCEAKTAALALELIASNRKASLSGFSNLLLLRTAILLAIAAVCCGMLGAVVSGLRGDHGVRARSLALGACSGFISFLVIRGGKAVFLAENGGDVPMLNPYSVALTALLAGLFTERAYGLLVLLVDDAIERFRGAIEGTPPPISRHGEHVNSGEDREQGSTAVQKTIERHEFHPESAEFVAGTKIPDKTPGVGTGAV